MSSKQNEIINEHIEENKIITQDLYDYYDKFEEPI